LDRATAATRGKLQRRARVAIIVSFNRARLH
jgi:hypothetical protein